MIMCCDAEHDEDEPGIMRMIKDGRALGAAAQGAAC